MPFSKQQLLLQLFNMIFQVYFSPLEIPSTHRISSATAFFVFAPCPVNFHHFWEDEFDGLYAIMKRTNRLHRNQGYSFVKKVQLSCE